VYNVSAIDSLLLKGNKDVLIFMYTDWCQYCAAMKQTTFKNKSVLQLINQHFFLVYFNAESKKEVSINGKQFRFIPTGVNTGAHELATALTGNSTPAYPFIAVMNAKRELVFTYNSYLSAKELTAVLNDLIRQKNRQQ